MKSWVLAVGLLAAAMFAQPAWAADSATVLRHRPGAERYDDLRATERRPQPPPSYRSRMTTMAVTTSPRLRAAQVLCSGSSPVCLWPHLRAAARRCANG